MRQLQNPLHTSPQTANKIRLGSDYSFSGEHLVHEGHEDRAHLLDYLLEATHTLGLCSFGGLATTAEDVLGFAVTFAAGLRDVSGGSMERGRRGMDLECRIVVILGV